MMRLRLTLLVSTGLVLGLTACGGAPAPVPTPSSTSSSTSTSTPEPTTSPSDADVEEGTEVEAALIPPRLGVTCTDLLTSSQRAALLGVDADDIERVTYPLANGSAAELQAGVLTCQWAGPIVGEESATQIDIKILPDAAAEFAAFAPPLSGTEAVGVLGAGSTVSCYEYDGARSCSAHYLAGSNWVDASFTGLVPTPASDGVAAATAFAGLISGALASSGPLAPAFAPPAASAAAWSSCAVLDASAGFRTALSSPSLVAPEAEFSGAGTLFAEAWQRVNFRSCVWRHADPYTSPAGQIRQVSVSMLPGAEWAWASLREAADDRGADGIALAGAEDATIICFDGDNCTIDALVRGSYVGVNLSVDQYRGGASALAIAAAEFVIARL